MEERAKNIQHITLWGAVCNIMLTIVKFVAGILGSSSAMIADAVHSASDLISDIVVIVFARISNKGMDKSHDYGHGKFETLAAFFVSLILLLVGVDMLQSSCRQIIDSIKGRPSAAPEMIALWAAIVSILTKEVLYQWSVRIGRKFSSPAVIANAWHHRTDALSSVASLLGIGGAIILGGQWTILDPIAGGIISVVIIVVAIKMSIPTLSELTEASLPEETEQKMLDIARSVKGVRGVHELKSRHSGRYIIVDFHIVVDPNTTIYDAHETTVVIEQKLREEFGEETQINIHIEPSDDSL